MDRPHREAPSPSPRQGAKVVAERPGDETMREQLQEMRENDGYPGWCGMPSASGDVHGQQKEKSEQDSDQEAVEAMTRMIQRRDEGPDKC